MNEMGKDITAMDVIESVVKSALSEVPYVKFYIQAIDSIKGNVLQRRYEQWQEKVGKIKVIHIE